MYQEAIKFAANKHIEANQLVPGTNLPYVVHLSNVAMEIFLASFHTKHFNLGFAVQVALLHDTLEDTITDFNEIEAKFGNDIAVAVAALTKDERLPKAMQMMDSLQKVKKLNYEVWAVKLADRITNLQSPPLYWQKETIINYQLEAGMILHELREGNDYLASRMEGMIEEYGSYINRL